MSLTSAYEAFLAFPNATHLSDDASLNYITTLITINGSVAVAKHVSQQQRIVKRKTEKVLSSIESDSAVCLDVETTLEFLTGGGAYLPGLDDNFLSDRVVMFPIVSHSWSKPTRISDHDCRSTSPTLTRIVRFDKSGYTGTKALFSSWLM